MGGSGDLKELGSGKEFGKLDGVLRRHNGVAITVQHQRRPVDVRQIRPEIPPPKQMIDLKQNSGKISVIGAIEPVGILDEPCKTLVERWRKGQGHEGGAGTFGGRVEQQVLEDLQKASAVGREARRRRGDDEPGDPVRDGQSGCERGYATHAGAEDRRVVDVSGIQDGLEILSHPPE